MIRPALIAALALGAAACMPQNDKAEAVLANGAEATPPVTGALDLNYRQAVIRDEVGNEVTMERASQGGLLVLVTYEVTNISQVPVPAGAIPAIRLFDRRGVAYTSDAGRTVAYASEPGAVMDMKSWSGLNPGITTQGGEVFEISAADWATGGWTVGFVGSDARYPVSPNPAA